MNFRNVGLAGFVSVLGVNDADEFCRFEILFHTIYEDDEYVKPNENKADSFVAVEDYTGFVPSLSVDDVEDKLYDTWSTRTSINYRSGQILTSFYNTITVKQRFYFYRFPIDRQLLTLSVESLNSVLIDWPVDPGLLMFINVTKHEMDSGMVPRSDGNVNQATYVVQCESNQWKLRGVKVMHLKPVNDTVGLSLTGKYTICAMVERWPLFYYFSFVTVTYCIVSTNICVLSIDVNESGNRNSISVTILLTLVTFKFVLTQNVPKIGYLTLLDHYVNLSFIFVMAGITENTIVSVIVFRFVSGFVSNFLIGTNASSSLEYEIAQQLQDLNDNAQFGDFSFQFVFLGLWMVVNIIMSIIFCFPFLVREDWDKVVGKRFRREKHSVARTAVVDDVMNWVSDEEKNTNLEEIALGVAGKIKDNYQQSLKNL